MERSVKPIACHVQHLDTTDFAADPRTWFQRQPNVGDETWFLAHADDGVIWGRLRDSKLITSDSVFSKISPPLQAITLQQARLFGQYAEVRVWRNGVDFQACRLEDQTDEEAEAFDERHILWGTQPGRQANGFTLVSDGRQGLRHAVPLNVSKTAFETNGKNSRPLRLLVRHYLSYDEDGQARIVLSRLVEVCMRGGQNEP